MFVSWTLHQAGFDQFAITTAKGYSAVYAGVDWFKKNDAWAGPEVVPEPGWVVFFGFGEGHTGLIKSARSITDITTIEGNTDSAGGGSGGKVMEKHRSATSKSDHILGYGVITYQDHQPSEEDDMYLPSFLAKSDDAKDSRVFLVEGNLAVRGPPVLAGQRDLGEAARLVNARWEEAPRRPVDPHREGGGARRHHGLTPHRSRRLVLGRCSRW